MQVANFYLLKDLSRLSGHSVHTIKFYLKIGLIKEAGRSPETRFRFFDDRTLERLSQIRAWRKERKGLAEIQLLLQQNMLGSGLRVQGSAQRPRAQSPEPRAELHE